MRELPLVVFDVNETLLDLKTLEPTFERIFETRLPCAFGPGITVYRMILSCLSRAGGCPLSATAPPQTAHGIARAGVRFGSEADTQQTVRCANWSGIFDGYPRLGVEGDSHPGS